MVSGGYNSWAFIFFFYNTCSAISNISSGSQIMCSINITWQICEKCIFHHLTTLGETAIKKLSRMKHPHRHNEAMRKSTVNVNGSPSSMWIVNVSKHLVRYTNYVEFSEPRILSLAVHYQILELPLFS